MPVSAATRRWGSRPNTPSVYRTNGPRAPAERAPIDGVLVLSARPGQRLPHSVRPWCSGRGVLYRRLGVRYLSMVPRSSVLTDTHCIEPGLAHGPRTASHSTSLKDVEGDVVVLGGCFEVWADVLAGDCDRPAEGLGRREGLGRGGRKRTPFASVAMLEKGHRPCQLA